MEQRVYCFFKVTVKGGHVGKKYYVPISFAICAENGKKAAAIAREIPRVKHDHKDAVLNCEKITYSEYVEIIRSNDNDPYLHCNSRKEQEQRCDLSDRLVVDPHGIAVEHDRKKRLDRIRYKNKISYYKNKETEWDEKYA